MILFETTSSVIEVLWDIALAFFVIRLAAIYALLNFLSLTILHYCAPYLSECLAFATTNIPTASKMAAAKSPLLMFLTLASTAICARYLIAHYEIPRVGGFRAAIGVVAAGMLGLMGLVYEAVEWELKHGEEKIEVDCVKAGVVLAWMAVLPLGLAVFERREKRDWEEGEVEEKLKDVGK